MVRKKKAGFVKVSNTVAQIEHQKYIDAQTREMVDDGFELHFTFLRLRDMQEEIILKEDQIVKDTILETYFGMPKPKGKLITELNILKYGYNRLLLEYTNLNEKMKKVHNLTDEDIRNIAIGNFNFGQWFANKKVIEHGKTEENS